MSSRWDLVQTQLVSAKVREKELMEKSYFGDLIQFGAKYVRYDTKSAVESAVKGLMSLDRKNFNFNKVIDSERKLISEKHAKILNEIESKASHENQIRLEQEAQRLERERLATEQRLERERQVEQQVCFFMYSYNLLK